MIAVPIAAIKLAVYFLIRLVSDSHYWPLALVSRLTLHGVVFQFFRSRLNLSVLAPFAIERAAIVQLMATASARVA